MKRSTKYQEKVKLVDSQKAYPLDEAIRLVKETSYANFDATIEAHFNLGLDPSKAEHQIRASISLPHGTGKKVRVLVFTSSNKAGEADEIGTQQTIDRIAKNGRVDFDAVVAQPAFMPSLAKIAKILGPKGLMPNPKSGTVTEKHDELIKRLKRGMVELRLEKNPVIHTIIGKTSFKAEELEENFIEVWKTLQSIRPAKTKGEYIKSAVLSATMGPGVKVDTSTLQ